MRLAAGACRHGRPTGYRQPVAAGAVTHSIRGNRRRARAPTEDSGKPLDVVCIGNAIVDVIAHADEEIPRSSRHGQGSMQLIDADVAHGTYSNMGPAVESSGGIRCEHGRGIISSFGGNVAFVGKIASDVWASVRARHSCGRCAVRGRRGRRRPRHGALPDLGDRRRAAHDEHVPWRIEPDQSADVDASLVERAKVVYCEGTSGIYRRETGARQGHGCGIEYRGKGRVHVSDASVSTAIVMSSSNWPKHRVDLLFANEAEICSLYQTESFDEAAERVAGHCELGVFDAKREGFDRHHVGGRAHHVDAVPVPQVGRHHRCRRSLRRRLPVWYTHGLDLAASSRLGCLAAAEVISHVGGASGSLARLPFRRRLTQKLEPVVVSGPENAPADDTGSSVRAGSQPDP